MKSFIKKYKYIIILIISILIFTFIYYNEYKYIENFRNLSSDEIKSTLHDSNGDDNNCSEMFNYDDHDNWWHYNKNNIYFFTTNPNNLITSYKDENFFIKADDNYYIINDNAYIYWTCDSNMKELIRNNNSLEGSIIYLGEGGFRIKQHIDHRQIIHINNYEGNISPNIETKILPFSELVQYLNGLLDNFNLNDNTAIDDKTKKNTAEIIDLNNIVLAQNNEASLNETSIFITYILLFIVLIISIIMIILNMTNPTIITAEILITYIIFLVFIIFISTKYFNISNYPLKHIFGTLTSNAGNRNI